MIYVDIILPLPLEGMFTYSVSPDMESRALAGRRVIVPFGRSKIYVGVIVRRHNDKPEFAVKSIKAVLDADRIVTERQIKLWLWIAEYYMAPVGEVFNAALPAGLKADGGYSPKTETCVTLAPAYRNREALNAALGMLRRSPGRLKAFECFLAMSHWDTIDGTACAEQTAEVTREELLNEAKCTVATFRNLVVGKFLNTYEREVGRLNHGGEAHPERIKRLSTEQQEAYNNIVFGFLKKKVVLFQGVTSSGKTEIYIHLIQQALERKQQVLYLLPEIALTVQICQRLREIFGNRLGIYHSKYSDAERVEIWRKQLGENGYDIILGVRSSVFLPFRNLGLVIVDEEHENTYKQQDPAPRYHARSAAIVLAAMYGAKTLLGTATPSIETWQNATDGKYGFVQLKERYKEIQLPEIIPVDIKELHRKKRMVGQFSPLLVQYMKEALEQKEQVILFQNRRGFAPMIECRTCGWVPKCKNCPVSLTYHKGINQLTCHYCGYTYQLPKACPACEGTELVNRGFGTEKIEDDIKILFPEAAVARMDLDTTRTRSAYEKIIADFEQGKTDILIGTQMVSKGLDFDHVSIVGILNPDPIIAYFAIGSTDIAFQLMAQVAGRAGRKNKRGRVILQTKSIDHPIIHQVIANDYEDMVGGQLAERQMFHYPPYYRLVYVYLKNHNESLLDQMAAVMAGKLRAVFGNRVLGPDKPPVARIQTLFIKKIVVKIEQNAPMGRARELLLRIQREMIEDERYKSLIVYYDVDPM